MKKERHNRGYWSTVFGCYCPRCREGKLFKQSISIRLKGNMEMYSHCPLCGQPTDIEVGFYYGTGYVSYLIAIFLSVASFLTWWLLIGFSFTDNRFTYWISFNSISLLLLQPWLMRFSRSIWIAGFVRYDSNWKETTPQDLERTNSSQMNNW
jgi:uncharacterized protein (DUF983 family)